MYQLLKLRCSIHLSDPTPWNLKKENQIQPRSEYHGKRSNLIQSDKLVGRKRKIKMGPKAMRERGSIKTSITRNKRDLQSARAVWVVFDWITLKTTILRREREEEESGWAVCWLALLDPVICEFSLWFSLSTDSVLNRRKKGRERQRNLHAGNWGINLFSFFNYFNFLLLILILLYLFFKANISVLSLNLIWFKFDPLT